MKIALEVVCGFYAAIATGSASGKLTRNRRVLATMRAVGVSDRLVPWLAVLELLGALGIVVGVWVRPLGLAACVGLSAYFVGATLAHVRAKDEWKVLIPPVVLVLIGVASSYLELKR